MINIYFTSLILTFLICKMVNICMLQYFLRITWGNMDYYMCENTCLKKPSTQQALFIG